jgi:hypothetical protein
MSDFKFEYDPPVTLDHFMQSDKLVRAVRGPVGSAKSTAMAMEMLRRACQQEPGADGIRRSRGVIIRNTLQQLKTTCLVTIQQLLRPIIRYKVSDQTIQVRFNDVEADWLLLPLDTPDNIDRLLSLELTYAWISEFREINPEILESLLGRVGRFPSKAVGGPTWHGVFMETNSFTQDSGWYEKLDLSLPANYDYFIQPGAFEPDAENRENLPPGYYENLMEANSDEWVDQYIHNLIGPSLSGQAVFRNSFDTSYHVADGQLLPVPGHPLIIGMDFARHPAAIIGQIDHIGRLLIFKELEQENCGVERFITEFLSPALAEARFASNPVYIVGDPSGIAKSQIGEESTFMAVRRIGYTAYPASTNHIDPRLRAVEKFLIQNRGGEPAFLIDPDGCPLLIRSLQYEYKYKIKKNGQLEDKPDKVRPWADLCDALQYLCLGTAQNIRGRVMRPKRDFSESQPASAAGWT